MKILKVLMKLFNPKYDTVRQLKQQLECPHRYQTWSNQYLSLVCDDCKKIMKQEEQK